MASVYITHHTHPKVHNVIYRLDRGSSRVDEEAGVSVEFSQLLFLFFFFGRGVDCDS